MATAVSRDHLLKIIAHEPLTRLSHSDPSNADYKATTNDHNFIAIAYFDSRFIDVLVVHPHAHNQRSAFRAPPMREHAFLRTIKGRLEVPRVGMS